jgi:hypothetical protein
MITKVSNFQSFESLKAGTASRTGRFLRELNDYKSSPKMAPGLGEQRQQFEIEKPGDYHFETLKP